MKRVKNSQRDLKAHFKYRMHLFLHEYARKVDFTLPCFAYSVKNPASLVFRITDIHFLHLRHFRVLKYVVSEIMEKKFCYHKILRTVHTPRVIDLS